MQGNVKLERAAADLTVSQVAAELGLHYDTVRRLLLSGLLPGYKADRKQWRITPRCPGQFQIFGRSKASRTAPGHVTNGRKQTMPKKSGPLRYAIYSRCSSDDQAHKDFSTTDVQGRPEPVSMSRTKTAFLSARTKTKGSAEPLSSAKTGPGCWPTPSAACLTWWSSPT